VNNRAATFRIPGFYRHFSTQGRNLLMAEMQPRKNGIPTDDVEQEPVDVLKWNGYAIQAKMVAEGLNITNDTTEIQAVDSLKQIKDFLETAEATRKLRVAPFNDMVNRINDAFRPITHTLREAERLLKSKLLDWQERKQQMSKELRDRQRQEYEAARHEGEHVPLPPIILPPSATMFGNTGKASRRTVWRWRVVDLSKLPKELILPNEKLINERIRTGQRNIEGLEIYQDTVLAMR
jgi:hypothetical protein